MTSEAGQVNVECFLCSAPTKVCQRAPVTLTKGRAANSSKVIAQSVFRVAQRLECTIRYLLSLATIRSVMDARHRGRSKLREAVRAVVNR